MSESVAQIAPSEGSVASLKVGDVVVQDHMGVEISRSTAAVLGGTWVALPIWALFGRENLVFQSSESGAIRIERGFWEAGDPAAIWQLEAGKKWNTPGLVPWKQYVPLQWHSVLLKGSSLQVEVASLDRKGSFLGFPLADEIREPGVFMQEGRIVGWTFGDETERGYLWAGPAGADLVPKIQVDQFYGSIVPNCREAHFSRVLARADGIPAAGKLEAFAAGFHMDPRFAAEDMPTQLRPQSIVTHMHILASEIIQNGLAEDVVRALDEHVLTEAQDTILVKDAVLALAKSEDYNKAIRFLERVRKNILEIKGEGLSALDKFQAQLYKDWLRKIIEKGSYYSGMVAFEEAKQAFPNDIELHLLGVEVAIAEKNWERASELLRMRDYPLLLKGRADRLESLIKERQENEEAIVIGFIPGEKNIPVEVVLNGTHLQKFLIDTGASTSSIPSEAVEALRIKIDERTPVRAVSGLGEVVLTYEITLESIELKGHRVYNVKALIIDLPGYPDYGLLGLNFLNNFHIEIDNKKGILRLKKR